jgi:hypothetical protein
MKAKVFPAKPNEDEVFLALVQENDRELLLMLADSNGKPIEDSEILRIAPDFIEGKLRILKITGRQSIKAITSKFVMDGTQVKVF